MKPPIDLAAAFAFATADPEWLKKAALAGLYLLVPLIGPFVVLGWQKRVMAGALTATEIPPVELGTDLAEGFRVFFALVLTIAPLVVVLMVVQCAGVLPSVVAGQIEGDGLRAAVGIVAAMFQLAGAAVFLVVMLAYQLLLPDLMRRIFRGELVPLLSLGPTIAAVRRSPGPYLVVFAGTLVANVVGSLGIFACLVGVVVTYPLSLLILSHVLAQWDRLALAD
jgi:hypothetical protein